VEGFWFGAVAVFGGEEGHLIGLIEVFELFHLVWLGFLKCAGAGAEEGRVQPSSPPTPTSSPELIAGRKRSEGEEKGIKGLARYGNRLPSGARPSRPSQTVQVAGRMRRRGNKERGDRSGGGARF
jgi:hypothetical protein